MQLTEVIDKRLAKEFIRVNVEINKNDPNYIQPLDKDINEVFDPAKNKTFRQGEAIRWILKDDEGKLIGRIAAFTNRKYKNKGDDVPVGGIGFFDCINDQLAADMLFDVSKHWLLQQGMEAMDGPINFGERDQWWGLVVQGFQEPLYGMNYNPPYYVNFFEKYGFKTQYEQITNHVDAHKPFPERFTKIAEWVSQKPGYEFKHFKASEIERFADDFMEIYNDGWKDFENFVPIVKFQSNLCLLIPF